MKNKSASKIIRELRKRFGYTQKEVAEWIQTDRSNYTRKEKDEGGVTLTADEFLIILDEFHKRKHKNQENHFNSITSEINYHLIKEALVSYGSTEPDLSDEEKSMIEAFRKLPPRSKRSLYLFIMNKLDEISQEKSVSADTSTRETIDRAIDFLGKVIGKT